MSKHTPIIDRLNRDNYTLDQLDEIAAAVERKRRALGVGSDQRDDEIAALKAELRSVKSELDMMRRDDVVTGQNAHNTLDYWKSLYKNAVEKTLMLEDTIRQFERQITNTLINTSAQLTQDYQKHGEIATEIRRRVKDGKRPKFDEFILPVADRVTLTPEFNARIDKINHDDRIISTVLQNGGSIRLGYALNFLIQNAITSGQFAAFTAMYEAGRQIDIHDDSVIAARIMARLNFYNDILVDHVASLSAEFMNSLKPNLNYETLRQGLIYAHRSYNGDYRTVEDAAADFGIERRQLFRYREWYEKLRKCRETVKDVLADAIENGSYGPLENDKL